MHIEFVSVRWKNFLSYGNKWTEIGFPSGFRAIRGFNGAGKSTIIDALFYGLFGKTYRDVKMDELVNRVNGSDMLVEVKFRKDGDLWTITRGRAPAVLSIEKNGETMDLLSSKSLTQGEIEKLLGINQELFKRIVVLSINMTKPFMTMTAQEQREFLSDMFNLNVFSKMLAEVKRKMSDLKVDLKVSETEVRSMESAYDTASRAYGNAKSAKEALDADRDGKRIDLETKRNDAKTELERLEQEMKGFSDEIERVKSEIEEPDLVGLDKLKEELAGLKRSAQEILKDIDFFSKNETCPVCGQHIDDHFKEEKMAELEGRKCEIGTEGREKQKLAAGITEKISAKDQKMREVRGLEGKIGEVRVKMGSEQSKIRFANEQLGALTGAEIDLCPYAEELKRAGENLKEAKEKYGAFSADMRMQKMLTEILSDGGVRGYYIGKYVEVVDSAVNRRLTEFGLNLSFLFDARNEAGLTDGKNKICYMSCSEGEKKRIDMAILLAFIEVTKALSSWDCNVIFFDELFDSSVDDTNLGLIVGSVKEMTKATGQCVYVITHRDLGSVGFDGVLNISKPSRFSCVEENDCVDRQSEVP